jgi:hypothetical protein
MLKMINLTAHLDFKLYFYTKLVSKPTFLLTPFFKLYNHRTPYSKGSFYLVYNGTVEENKNISNINYIKLNSIQKELLTQFILKITYLFGSKIFQNLSLYFR